MRWRASLLVSYSLLAPVCQSCQIASLQLVASILTENCLAGILLHGCSHRDEVQSRFFLERPSVVIPVHNAVREQSNDLEATAVWQHGVSSTPRPLAGRIQSQSAAQQYGCSVVQGRLAVCLCSASKHSALQFSDDGDARQSLQLRVFYSLQLIQFLQLRSFPSSQLQQNFLADFHVNVPDSVTVSDYFCEIGSVEVNQLS